MAEPRKPRFGRVVEVSAIAIGIVIGGLGWWLRAPVIAAPAPAEGPDTSAAVLSGAAHAPMLAATRAGSRLVAVGEHGVVLLSDDEGASWRQARAVPTKAMLTTLSFADAQQGWAAGHDGVILHTADGGEHWSLQREDRANDKPLLSIRFADALHGLAVGMFGLALRTDDGGATWTPFTLLPGSDDDKHLYALFGNADVLCIAAEAGAVYRSLDGGMSWTLVQTSNIGSFWAGAALADGSLLVAGQRGHIFASHDRGATWVERPSGTQQSLTAIVQRSDGTVLVSGLAGTLLESRDAANSFTATARPDRLPLTAMVPGKDGAQHLFGSEGPVDE